MRTGPLTVLSILALTADCALAGGSWHAQAADGRPSGFPDRFTAPYIASWGSPQELARARQDTGLRFFTLAFVVSDGGCTGAFDGRIPIGDPGWLTAVEDLRTAGGDAIVSFGGGDGRDLAQVCESVPSLKSAYRQVVETYALTRIDIDIEGRTLDDQEANDRRNQSLTELQNDYAAAGKGLAVQYTLPVNPWGLSANAQKLLDNAHSHALAVDVVNIMAMHYGPTQDMGATAIRASNGLHSQLARIWPEKTSQQVWAMQGVTPMIGVNGVDEIFTTDDAARLAGFATENGIKLLSFWSLGRDKPCATEGTSKGACSGTSQAPGDFARLLNPSGASLRHAATTAGRPAQ